MKVTANDVAGAAVSSSFALTVTNTNDAPTVSAIIPNQSGSTGGAWSYLLPANTFADADVNDTLTLAAVRTDGSPLPAWLSFDAVNRRFSGTPDAGQVGDLGIKVIATDGAGASVSSGFVLSVTAASTAGVVVANPQGSGTLTGSAGDDTFTAGAGSDILIGGAGNDSFLVDAATGDWEFDTYDGGAGFDTIQGGTGNDSILLKQYGGSQAVERIDGGAGFNRIVSGGNLPLDLSSTELLRIDLIEGSGQSSDVITGSTGNDRIQGHGGADRLSGGGGADVFLVDGADGDWEGDIYDGGSGVDTILGGAGNDTVFLRDYIGTQVVEVIDGGAGVNRIVAMGANPLDLSNTSLVRIDRIEGNGQSADVITGTANADTIMGRGGADRLVGGGGDDVFLVDATDNDWEGDIYQGDAGFDTIRGGSGNDTVILKNFTGSQTVEKIDGGGGFDAIQVSNIYGDTLDLSATQLASIERIAGGGGNDTITGSATGDSLSGGAGNDRLSGGLGNDTYLFSRGDGADMVTENDATAGNTDVALFGTGIATDQLWFRQVGNDLEVSIIGTGDKVNIGNWYLGNQYHVEQFKTSDGHTLLDSQVQNLVQAMASFAPPAAGQTTLPPNYASSLAPTLAANWQ